ncbi:motility protein A [Sphingomonas corticis]|jgi:chemotaxis protein MotA|uniref:Biopolymer transporter ExbB n=1 Tax=Sphingomonas corticis TaxID=2722791 RepID=A0ABX1CR58_9SPHN|nr:MotA/TolQ/ExbB proton channel family protein [Sphingomonas corticis]NJR79756.1 biopolymer transporter ExbB [Sphingomonas corticis]
MTPGTFLDPAALAIVLGGTAAAAVLRTPLRDLARAVAALATLWRRRFDAEPLLLQVAAQARIAQKLGVVALDRSIVADPDLAAAMAAIVDGDPPADIAAALELRRQERIARHRAAADCWAGIADAAPAMGMIGTLVGLVAMFARMTDAKAIGAAMAVALLATLYGALVANLVALPIATRLRNAARAEAEGRARLAAPVLALALREAPARARMPAASIAA